MRRRLALSALAVFVSLSVGGVSGYLAHGYFDDGPSCNEAIRYFETIQDTFPENTSPEVKDLRIEAGDQMHGRLHLAHWV